MFWDEEKPLLSLLILLIKIKTSKYIKINTSKYIILWWTGVQTEIQTEIYVFLAYCDKETHSYSYSSSRQINNASDLLLIQTLN